MKCPCHGYTSSCYPPNNYLSCALKLGSVTYPILLKLVYLYGIWPSPPSLWPLNLRVNSLSIYWSSGDFSKNCWTGWCGLTYIPSNISEPHTLSILFYWLFFAQSCAILAYIFWFLLTSHLFEKYYWISQEFWHEFISSFSLPFYGMTIFCKSNLDILDILDTLDTFCIDSTSSIPWPYTQS